MWKWVLAAALLSAGTAWAGDLERAALFAQLEGNDAPEMSGPRAAPSSQSAPAAPRSARADTGVADEIRAFNGPRQAKNPEFTREKLLRIAGGAWPFMRGTAHLFYRGLATDPALSVKAWITPATCKVVVQGDMHLQNCGSFENAHGKIRYDIQDFDDALRAPFVVDVARAATSVLLMAEEAGVSADDARAAARALIEEYAASIDAVLDGSLDADFAWKKDDARGPVAAVLERAHGMSRKDLLKKRLKDRKFKRGEKFFDVPARLASAITDAVGVYAESRRRELGLPAAFFTVLDVARKKGNGVGSIGLDDFVVLIDGPSAGEDDDVILELKEQATQSLAAYLPTLCAGEVPPPLDADAAQRAVDAQQALQSHPDRFVGATRIARTSFIVREDSPAKDAVEPDDVKNAKDLRQLAEAVGRLIAKGHARQSADPKGPGAIGRKIQSAIGDPKAFVSGLMDVVNGSAARVRAEYKEYLKSPLAHGAW